MTNEIILSQRSRSARFVAVWVLANLVGGFIAGFLENNGSAVYGPAGANGGDRRHVPVASAAALERISLVAAGQCHRVDYQHFDQQPQLPANQSSGAVFGGACGSVGSFLAQRD